MFSLYFLVLTDSLVLTEWMMNLYSPASAATDMDIDKTPNDEETDDVATSKPVSLPDLNLFGCLDCLSAISLTFSVC